MRLDKFLSKATELSRKDAKKFFMLVKLLSMAPSSKTQVIMLDLANDEILWAGEALSVADGNRYILLYKPDGFECTLKPKEYPMVTDLIAVPEVANLRIAGRLDVDTTGALLLSDDGAWLHRVTSPKRHQPKQYQLTLADAMDKDAQAYAIKQIANGILLEGETEKPAQLSCLLLMRRMLC